jgi:hypothetical protein
LAQQQAQLQNAQSAEAQAQAMQALTSPLIINLFIFVSKAPFTF